MSNEVLREMTKTIVDLRARIEELETQDRAACKFLAYNTVTDTDVTGDNTAATIDFDTEVFDLGGNFASDTFTAPTTDKYFLHAVVQMSDIVVGHTVGYLLLVTSNRTYYGYLTNVGAMDTTFGVRLAVSALCDMDATDTATVTATVDGGGKDVDVEGHANLMITYFCGYRIP